MKILLSNDDGIFAKGIETLAMVLIERGHDVYVVAPDEDAMAGGQGGRRVADRQIGGLGIFLTREMVDDIQYRRENDRNIIAFLIRKP